MDGNTNRGSELGRLPGCDHGLADRLNDQVTELLQGLDGLELGQGDHHYKLVATHTPDQCIVASGLLESIGHGHQRIVARNVAEGVVDSLKAVEVDEQQCQGVFIRHLARE